MDTVVISSIRLGKRRRQHMGNLQELANSIQAVGLLHPIVIRPDGQLVCGARRLAAFRDILGKSEIPARVLDIDAIARGERDENACRLDFTPSEEVEIWSAVLEEEKHDAKDRQGARGLGGKFPQGRWRKVS